ncbi:MAG: glutamate--cysteine ligase [Verrucomicrobia bacterium]|nr:glutamate--cysteine ligase [Verrucomicrobiota bacterium]
MTGSPPALRLWAGTGVELEYMIVDAETLEVRPIADRLIQQATGRIQSDVDRGGMAWSNELVLHLIELKTNGPVPQLTGLATLFHGEIREINGQLEQFGARLMPSGMHPWMDPKRDARLWPHEYAEVYQTYDRIFGCHSHGYANLQSMHLNLSFADDPEFGRLHAATRVLLPLLPAIAASSPFIEGRHPGWLDHRLEVYRHNADRIPAIAGRVIPEPVFSRAAYQREILDVIYQAISPFDPTGSLQDEFLNARGAIARFSRGSLELRLMDVQECPKADLALAQLVVTVLQLLTGEQWSSLADLQGAPSVPLEQVLDKTARQADAAILVEPELLRLFGWPGSLPCTAGELWQHLVRTALATSTLDPESTSALELILRQGPLARRLLKAAGSAPDRDRLRSVYRRLCECLAENRLFDSGAAG